MEAAAERTSMVARSLSGDLHALRDRLVETQPPESRAQLPGSSLGPRPLFSAL